jgi:hypothetical protein
MEAVLLLAPATAAEMVRLLSGPPCFASLLPGRNQ